MCYQMIVGFHFLDNTHHPGELCLSQPHDLKLNKEIKLENFVYDYSKYAYHGQMKQC